MEKVVGRFRPRSAGLRLWLALSFGLLAIVMVGVLSWRVERVATDKLQDDIGLRLQARALALAGRLDRGLFERLNDMRALALMPMLDEPEENEQVLRDLFDLMQLTFPDYLWIGVVGADGKVRVGSRGLLEGDDASARPWFIGGIKDLYVGDLHEALLLSKYMSGPGGEPLIVLDVAAPVHDDHGAVVGVMIAQLSWRWAEGLRQDQMRPSRANDPVEVFFLSPEGEVLMGPGDMRGTVLRTPSALAVARGERGAVLETWPDGRQYLTGYVPTEGHEAYGGLGWTVLVRKQADLAFEPVHELSRQVWVAAIVLTIMFLLLGTVMARGIGAPLHALARSAKQIQAREPGAAFPPARGYREARELTGALRSLVDDLTAHEHELTKMAEGLEQRVRERTQALSEANAQLEVLAMTDGLTGLANRRHFGDQLARATTRAAETGRPLSLVTLDIDHFKAINDQHGHPAGDVVLRRMALLLEEEVRASDLLARVGGEEFAVLAVDTGMIEASQLAERLRAAVEGAGPLPVGRTSVPVTISLGVVTRRIQAGEVTRAPEQLLAAADDALYRAKRNGRNRVEVSTGAVPDA
ncbi:sensor domain-containing diguanylate cyclase [Arenimonas donghaensis]|uniref:sensor domain-containing diguanylate cyclase n=1 Tax=Arenimonas donghaensis TaxID=375061 RepID=UPI0012688B93|nr:sensor domain-containing diguanylate cyclase [Arenimonas donghaensis]